MAKENITLSVAESIVIPALKKINHCELASMELVLGTGLHESNAWLFRKQIHGPALGMWQMEPRTANYLWDSVVSKRPQLKQDLLELANASRFNPGMLIDNDKLSAAMCRVHYLNVKVRLPLPGDLVMQARYWKKYYNTCRGKGIEQSYINAWNANIDYPKLKALITL